MVKANRKRPTITFHADQEFIDFLDMEAKSVGLTRAEFVKTLVLTIMNYKKDINQKEFMTMTAGELKQKIMPLPNELPVTVHDINTGWDYRLTDFFIKGIYGEFGVRKMDPVHKDWDYKDLFR